MGTNTYSVFNRFHDSFSWTRTSYVSSSPLLGSNNNNPLPQLPNKYTTTTAYFLNFQISTHRMWDSRNGCSHVLCCAVPLARSKRVGESEFWRANSCQGWKARRVNLGFAPQSTCSTHQHSMELATNQCWTGIKRVLGGYSVWSKLELSVLVFWLGYVKTELEIESDFWNPVPDPKLATFYELKFKHEIVKK
jgi:hypothetical protein